MSRERDKDEKLLKLRAKLEFIKNSNIPKKVKHQKPHALIVTEALNYLYELDEVEDYLDSIYVDNFTVTNHFQFDELIDRFKHKFLHCGNYIRVAQITVLEKNYFIVAITPISDL